MAPPLYHSIRHQCSAGRRHSPELPDWLLHVGAAHCGHRPADPFEVAAAPAELRTLLKAVQAAAPGPEGERRWGIVEADAAGGNVYCVADGLGVPAAREGRFVIAGVGMGSTSRPQVLGRIAARRLAPSLSAALFEGLYRLPRAEFPHERAAREAAAAEQKKCAERQAADERRRQAAEREAAAREAALVSIADALTGGDTVRAQVVVRAIAVRLGLEPATADGAGSPG